MSYKPNRRGILALEDNLPEEFPVTSDISLNEVQDLNYLAQAQDVMVDYSIKNEITDDRIDAVDALSDIHEAMAGAEEVGGLNEHEAQIINVAVEHFCKLGFVSAPVRVSLEQYSGTASRKQALRASMEGISDAIKSMIKKIIDWIKRIFTSTKDSVVAMATGADKLVKTARRVADNAKAIADKTIPPNNKVMKDYKLAAFFSKSSAVIPADQLLNLYADYCEFANQKFKNKFIKQLGANTYNASEAARKGVTEEVVAAKASEILTNLKKEALDEFVANSEASDENKEGLRYDLPFGQRHISAVFNKDGERYTGFVVKVGEDPKLPKDIAEKGVTTLTHKQIVDLTKAVEKQLLFGIYKDYKISIDDLEKMQKAVNKACEDISRQQEKEEHSVTFSVNFLKDLMASAVAMTSAVYQYDISVSRALLEYCDKSIRQHV